MNDLKRTWVEIDLDALAHNYHALRARIGDGVKFLGVVKADAYGHGAIAVSRTLEELGADYLAVSSLDEARELRANGISLPILLLGHTPTDQVPQLIANDITQTVSCEKKAEEYEAAAAKIGKKLRVHIKVDTGMSRLGFICAPPHLESGTDAILRACRLPHLDVEGIFTHFAVSDDNSPESKAYTDAQFRLFCAVIDRVEANGFHFRIRHCANTGAVANYPETYLDMVRPGLLLYGYGDDAARLGLRPVMCEKSVINTIKIYDPGTFISYGRQFETTARTRIGVLPIGYADGFFRCLSNRYAVMTTDGPAPIRGKICMDMCMVDLTDLPNVQVGAEVEIFGPHNPLEHMAEMAGTIPYELTCAVSKRVPRVFIRGGQVIDRELRLKLGNI